MRARPVTLGIVLGTLLAVSAPSWAAWLAEGSGGAYTRAGTWEGCTPGSATVTTSSKDAYVVSNFPATSHGGETSMEVDGNGSSIRRSFVAFNVPEIPEGCTLTSATLSLHVTESRGQLRTINAYRVTGSWTEPLSWSSQPAVDTSVASALFQCCPTGTRVTWEVTDLLEGEGFSLRMGREDLGSAQTKFFVTREGSLADQRPRLTVEWA
jgi:hypothetical protein